MKQAAGSACVDPDWNEIWKARQKQQESSCHFDDPSHDWNKRENAKRYSAHSRKEYDNRVSLTLAGLEINRDSRVLDIGSGPGTLTIPLAPLVKEVTAVEPGAGMADLLMEQAKNKGLTNVSYIRKRWEDIDPAVDLAGPYDVVIASLSLTMHDIREALAKMNEVCSGTVYLFWFVDSPFWERMYTDLWEQLHGSSYYSGPKADCLFGVLYQMGIYANVRMLPMDKEYRFPTREEMIAFFVRRFNATTPAQEQLIADYLAPLIHDEGKEVVISGDSTFAQIWWKK